MQRKINVHVGAHKTATTYIQKVLMASRKTLKGRGVKCIPTRNVRKNVTRRILGYKHRGISRTSTVRGIREYIDKKFTGEYRTLVLSEENLIGSSGEIHRRSDLYPSIADRLKLLSDALQGYEVNVFFCIRDYVDFFPSAYCEYLRHNDFIRFEQYLGSINPRLDGWPRVVGDITGVFGREKTHVWCYEDFRKGAKSVLAALVSSTAADLKYDIDDARPSISDQSIRALYKLDEVLAPAETRKLVKAVTVAFPKGDGYRGYSPWDDEQRLLWSQKYSNDVDVIRRQQGVCMDLR